MLEEGLFDTVLIDPVREGADQLCVVSGYATPTMASQHLNHIRDELSRQITLNLIVGMTREGVARKYHMGFQALENNQRLGIFSCSYVPSSRPPVHAKVYIWLRGDDPIMAYVGSANYTQTAFFGAQRELIQLVEPTPAYEYYERLTHETIFCHHGEVEESVLITEEDKWVRSLDDTPIDEKPEISGLDSVICPLVQRNGRVHSRSGLNWGQRLGRNPNQAYIPVPAEIGNSGFFPDRGTHFTILTDDGKVLIGRRAQDNGKAIETPTNNSLLGEYFRQRMGLPNGAVVTDEDLHRYGRQSVQFFKIDDETYYMDFSRS